MGLLAGALGLGKLRKDRKDKKKDRRKERQAADAKRDAELSTAKAANRRLTEANQVRAGVELLTAQEGRTPLDQRFLAERQRSPQGLPGRR